MNTNNIDSSVVVMYETHGAAEQAIRDLQHSGYDMKKLSIIGRDYHTEESVVGYYSTGDRMMAWGGMGAFWGGIWGMLFGAAFFWVPGLGPLLMAGPFVTTIVGALEGAAVMGGLSALGAALFSMGIPRDSVLRYETQIKAGRYMVAAHGTPEEVERARRILGTGLVFGGAAIEEETLAHAGA